MKEKKFDWGYFLRHIAIIAVPVALQNLLTTTGSMVDTIMLAKLGEKAVGAVGLCAQFSSLMFAGYWGFVGGGMLFFSQYWGAKDDDGITRSYGLTLLFMLSVGLLFACLALFAPEFVMRVYTDKPEIQKIGVSYLRIVGLAYPLQVLAMAMSALLLDRTGADSALRRHCFSDRQLLLIICLFLENLVCRVWVQPERRSGQ